MHVKLELEVSLMHRTMPVRNFCVGVGVGLVVGSTIGAAMMPHKRRSRSAVSKTLRTAGEIFENIGDIFSF